MAKTTIARRVTRDSLASLINKIISPKERIELAAELARGVKLTRLVGPKDNKTEIVFAEKPDLEAIRFLEEHVSGKPVQKQQVSLDDDLKAIIIPALKPNPDVQSIRDKAKP